MDKSWVGVADDCGMSAAMGDFGSTPSISEITHWPFPSEPVVSAAEAELARIEYERKLLDEKLNAAHMMVNRLAAFLHSHDEAHWDAAMTWIPKE